MADTITDSVNKAVDEHSDKGEIQKVNGEVKPAEETKKETNEDTKEEKKEETPANKWGLTEKEIEQAQELLAALRDPKAAPAVVDWLATRAGYKKIDTPEKAEEVKETITDSIKKKLGPDLDYLADKLVPAIEELIDKKLESNTRDIRENIEKTQEEKLQIEAATAMTKIARDVFKDDNIPDNVLDEMNKLMDRMPPSKDMTVTEYLENIYYSVAGRLGVKPVDKVQEDRRNKNRTDAPSRLASGGTKSPPASGEVATFKTLDEAVRAAIAAESEKET